MTAAQTLAAQTAILYCTLGALIGLPLGWWLGFLSVPMEQLVRIALGVREMDRQTTRILTAWVVWAGGSSQLQGAMPASGAEVDAEARPEGDLASNVPDQQDKVVAKLGTIKDGGGRE